MLFLRKLPSTREETEVCDVNSLSKHVKGKSDEGK